MRTQKFTIDCISSQLIVANSCVSIQTVNTRTLPHPRHNSHMIDARARDDQMIGKSYMPSPSPALPLDGSYYNMNSDRYLSYPPMVIIYCILYVRVFDYICSNI